MLMSFPSLLTFGTNAAHYVIPFLIVLGVVVFVHEFGHFWVARRCGVKIEAFSIGFGPAICGWNDRHGTRWMLSWIPLGGYVKMFGDSDPTSVVPGEEVKSYTDDEKKQTFFYQPVNHRLAIAAAGPATNYLFGVVVLAFLFFFNGQPFTAPVAETVVEGSAAAKAGFLAGDKVVSIDGAPIDSFEAIKRTIALNAGTPVTIVLDREGVSRTLTLTPDVVKTTDRLGGEHIQGRLGIASAALNYRELSPLQSVVAAGTEVVQMTTGTLKGVGQMIMGVRGSDELGGPLRIAEMSGKVASDGVAAFVWFLAVISVNLGLINLFPIPLLDGGHLLFYGVEKIRGRALSDRTIEYGARAGAVVVLSLMLFATWNDLVHLRVVAFLRGLFS
jgi:regulator of sigma E protease